MCKHQNNLISNHTSVDSERQFFENLADKRKSIFNDEWLNTDEAATFLKISKKSLLNAVSNGRIKRSKFGRLNRYLKSDLHKMLLASKKWSTYEY